MTATKDAKGNVYIRLNNGQVVSLKTFHKLRPEYYGQKTAEIMEALKSRKEVRI